MSDVSAAQVFGSVATDYNALRPDMPESALDFLLGGSVLGGTVNESIVDIGAGPGLLTCRLVTKARRVFAIEPNAALRLELRHLCPSAEIRNAFAESMPLPSGSMDRAVMANAWHWTNPERASWEICRVLRLGGMLGVSWTGLDWADPSLAGLDEIMTSAGPRNPRIGDFSVPEGSGFGPVEPCTVKSLIRRTLDDVVRLMGTYSRVIILPADRKEALFSEVRNYFARKAATGADTIDVPIITRCFRTRKENIPAA